MGQGNDPRSVGRPSDERPPCSRSTPTSPISPTDLRRTTPSSSRPTPPKPPGPLCLTTRSSPSIRCPGTCLIPPCHDRYFVTPLRRGRGRRGLMRALAIAGVDLASSCRGTRTSSVVRPSHAVHLRRLAAIWPTQRSDNRNLPDISLPFQPTGDACGSRVGNDVLSVKTLVDFLGLLKRLNLTPIEEELNVGRVTATPVGK